MKVIRKTKSNIPTLYHIPHNRLKAGMWLFSPAGSPMDQSNNFEWLVYIVNMGDLNNYPGVNSYHNKGLTTHKDDFSCFKKETMFYELTEEEAVLWILKNGPFK